MIAQTRSQGRILRPSGSEISSALKPVPPWAVKHLCMLDSPVRKRNGFDNTHDRALKGTFSMRYACTSFLSSWPILNAQYMWSLWTISQSQYPSNSAHQCPQLLILLILTIADTAGFCSAKLHLSCLPKPNANSLLGSLPKSLPPTGGTLIVTLLMMCEPMYTKWRDPEFE